MSSRGVDASCLEATLAVKIYGRTPTILIARLLVSLIMFDILERSGGEFLTESDA